MQRPSGRGTRPDLGEVPLDIPKEPRHLYGDEFIRKGGWGAWVGTKWRKGGWRAYDEAVKFVHSLKLKRREDWRAYCRGEHQELVARPMDVPVVPGQVYEEFGERGGWGAWLGTGFVANQNRHFRSYDEAVKFVHGLGLKSQVEWLAYNQGERHDLPVRGDDIPTDPGRVYAEFQANGGWGGWLGTKNRRGGWRSYDKAVQFVHTLQLKTRTEWRAYCNGGRPDLPERPTDIRATPQRYEEFRERGGMGAWLGIDGQAR